MQYVTNLKCEMFFPLFYLPGEEVRNTTTNLITLHFPTINSEYQSVLYKNIRQRFPM